MALSRRGYVALGALSFLFSSNVLAVRLRSISTATHDEDRPEYLASYYGEETRPLTGGVCNASTFTAGHNTFGGHFMVKVVNDLGDCCSKCAANTRCGHFTFDMGNRTCFLKEGHKKFTKQFLDMESDAENFKFIIGEPSVYQSSDFSYRLNVVQKSPQWNKPKPNIVVMIADDLGHFNAGFAGNPESRTPHLNQLAKDGVRLGRHYVYKYCSPTRSSFLSGRLPVHVSEKMAQLPDTYGVDVRMTTIAEKLSAQGYQTHHIGKWHAGSALEGQLPYNRGFKSSFGFLSGEEDYYTQEVGGYKDLWDTDGPAYGMTGKQYNTHLFTNKAVSIIKAHNTKNPLFLMIGWTAPHVPREVPPEYLNTDISQETRRTYEAMVYCMDGGVGNVTSALKKKGMWDNTLIVFFSDNGGRTDTNFGANNFPLRGQKFTDFEGGVRGLAFVTGGLIPEHRRGTMESGLMHVADWYATFCKFAGCDPSDPAKSDSGQNPPPDVDSVDQVWTLMHGAPSPRQVMPLPLSMDSLIMWPYKLVLGYQLGKGYWTQQIHPQNVSENLTIMTDDDLYGCHPNGCLFDIVADPSERTNLAETSTSVLQTMRGELERMRRGFWQTRVDINGEDPTYPHCYDQEASANAFHGFAAPLCFKKPLHIPQPIGESVESPKV